MCTQTDTLTAGSAFSEKTAISERIQTFVGLTSGQSTSSQSEPVEDPAPAQPAKLEYEFVHQPKHYGIFSPDDLAKLVAERKSIDVVAIANAVGLQHDAYMFNVLKYVLRKAKPGEPRRRDVEKIREYCDIWLDANPA